MIAAVLTVLSLAVGGATGAAPRAASQGDEHELPLEVRVPHMADAEAQLDHARRLKVGMRGKRGKERAFWRRLAIEAYLAVEAYHPAAHTLAAEASFRAAELARAGGDPDAARDAFRRAAELGREAEWRARALLELGHLARRAGDARGALDAYLEVVSDARAAVGHRDDAWLWSARIWWREGRRADARRAWHDVATEALDPLDRVVAYDDLALSYIEEGDAEAAAGVLDEANRSLDDFAAEETVLGVRVRKAVLRMRVIQALQRIARERAEAHEGTHAGDEERENSLKRLERKVEKNLTSDGRCFIGGAWFDLDRADSEPLRRFPMGHVYGPAQLFGLRFR